MRNKSGFWISIVATTCLIVLAVYNFLTNRCAFFNMSIATCLTILTAIWISFSFTQKRIDNRVQKETLMKLLNNIQSVVDDKAAYSISKDTPDEELTMRNRNLHNSIDILLKYASKFEIKPEAEFVEARIKEYTDLVGAHLPDKEYLSKSENELRRPLELVSSKLYDIMMKLYD